MILPTPKTKRNVLDMRLPRRPTTQGSVRGSLSSLTQDRNHDVALQWKRVNHAAEGRGAPGRPTSPADEAAFDMPEFPSSSCRYGQETVDTIQVVQDSLKGGLSLAGGSKGPDRPKTDAEIIAEMKAKMKGATSVPVFNSDAERDKWWFNRVGIDIERLKKGVIPGPFSR